MAAMACAREDCVELGQGEATHRIALVDDHCHRIDEAEVPEAAAAHGNLQRIEPVRATESGQVGCRQLARDDREVEVSLEERAQARTVLALRRQIGRGHLHVQARLAFREGPDPSLGEVHDDRRRSALQPAVHAARAIRGQVRVERRLQELWLGQRPPEERPLGGVNGHRVDGAEQRRGAEDRGGDAVARRECQKRPHVSPFALAYRSSASSTPSAAVASICLRSASARATSAWVSSPLR